MIKKIINSQKNLNLTEEKLKELLILSFSLGLDKKKAFNVVYEEIQELIQKEDNTEILFSLLFEKHPLFGVGLADIIEDISHVDWVYPFESTKQKIISDYLNALEDKKNNFK